jgi:TRAP-type C4-dicarboxylate transport system substrate-binding protein
MARSIPAIQTGVIDGAENNWPSFESSGHFEVAGYYTLNEHLIVPEVLVMSKVSWDKLSPEDQALVRRPPRTRSPSTASSGPRARRSEAKVRAAGVEIDRRHRQDPVHRGDGAGLRKHAVTTPKLQDLVERIQATE